MKSLFIIDDTLENKISYYHAAAFLIALPFNRFYSELVLISFMLHTLIHIDKQKIRSVLNSKNLLVSSVFFITLIGLFYSQDKSEGLKDLQKQLAVLLFPLLLAASGLDWKKYKMRLLLLFSLTCMLTILYLYIDSILIILHYDLPLSRLFSEVFINHNFSLAINIHATYLAMYSLLSAVILLYHCLEETNILKRTVYSLFILILLAGLLQLASRSVLISAIPIALCFAFMAVKKKNRIAFTGITAVISVCAVLIITNIYSFKTRYIAGLKDDLVPTSFNDKTAEPRIVRWGLVLKLVRQSPLYGYGSGSEKRLLNETYFANKLYISYLHELNAHNQYLSIVLKTGIWGLLIFLFTLLTALITALRGKDIFFISFLVIVCVVSFSENILDVNKGIFFYAFFFSLFAETGKPFGRLLRFNKGRESTMDSRLVNHRDNAATVRSNNYV